MFEYMKPFINQDDAPNCFWPLSLKEIKAAERELGYKFPAQLREFFISIGCGFFEQGVDEAEPNPYVVNRLVEPAEIANLVTNPESPTRPYEGFIDDEVLPFFELGECTYLVLRPQSAEPNKVYEPDGKTVIADSIEEFFQKLYHKSDFYYG